MSQSAKKILFLIKIMLCRGKRLYWYMGWWNNHDMNPKIQKSLTRQVIAYSLIRIYLHKFLAIFNRKNSSS